MDDALLNRLAERCGIQPRYHDIWGQEHAISDETKRRFLAAMNVPVDSERAMEIAALEFESRHWRRLLPRVAVITDDGSGRAVSLTLTLPAGNDQRELDWLLQLENGEMEGGSLRPADLREVERREVDGVEFVKLSFDLPRMPPCGYHRLSVRPHDKSPALAEGASMMLIVAPARCYQPPSLEQGKRTWGTALQLYGICSQRNWGVGDFTDLGRIVELVAELGGSAIGLNPLNALFPHNPVHSSPYAPSSRQFLNVIYIDVETVQEYIECVSARRLVRSKSFSERLERARRAELVDYREVSALKREVLERLFSHFQKKHLGPLSERAQAFAAFVSEGGMPLKMHALYEALSEELFDIDTEVTSWRAWPSELANPDEAEVERLLDKYQSRVAFFQYVQWLADQQLTEVAQRCEDLGMSIGLYTDLAVGVDKSGAEAWSMQRAFALEASAGAPPDDFSPMGQNWGLPPFVPTALTAMEYAPLIAVLRANMRHAGALRIDHVMGLMRLFWVPDGATAAQGAYVHYPFDDMLGIVALESHRNSCMVIGEDLGTVPDQVRESMQKRELLSYRLLMFEREDGGAFKAPSLYPAQALVAASTHDLPTIVGFWDQRDIDMRAELDLFPSEEVEAQARRDRVADHRRLLEALQSEGLLPQSVNRSDDDNAPMTPELVVAIHRYLARTPSKLMMIQWEDLLQHLDQANLPGTTDEHPNWRRRLSVDFEQLREASLIQQVAQVLREERGD